MKRSTLRAATPVATMLAFTPAFAQGDAQIITIPLSNPGEPYELDIDILSAHIEVIGEAREDLEFAITMEQGSRKIITPSGTQPITAGAYELEVDPSFAEDADQFRARMPADPEVGERGGGQAPGARAATASSLATPSGLRRSARRR